MVEKTNTMTHCKKDNTPLVLKTVKKTHKQSLKPYYYTAYFLCPQCKRMYFSDRYKVLNTKEPLFADSSLGSKKVDVEIWTDGACSSNGTNDAKAAWAFVSGSHEERDFVNGKQTNNVAEAEAVLYALAWASKMGHKRIRLHTDSQITIHGVMKNPDLVKENREIFKKIYDVVTKNSLEVDYIKVLGHSGDPNNERADRLAATLVGKR